MELRAGWNWGATWCGAGRGGERAYKEQAPVRSCLIIVLEYRPTLPLFWISKTSQKLPVKKTKPKLIVGAKEIKLNGQEFEPANRQEALGSVEKMKSIDIELI